LSLKQTGMFRSQEIAARIDGRKLLVAWLWKLELYFASAAAIDVSAVSLKDKARRSGRANRAVRIPHTLLNRFDRFGLRHPSLIFY
jgi:hypothetical protein